MRRRLLLRSLFLTPNQMITIFSKIQKILLVFGKKSEVYQLLCEKRNFRVVRIFGLVTELQFSKEVLCKNLMLEGHVLVQEQFHQQ